MSDDWANLADDERGGWPVFGADLHLNLTGSGLRNGLMNALRDAVRTGRLTPGIRLPSSRSLAADLGMARNTVADSYAELIAEGWLTAASRVRAPVWPCADHPGSPAHPHPPAPPRPRPAYGLLPGSPNLAELTARNGSLPPAAALNAAPHDALGYADPLGRVELRSALAEYLARSRGV